jgi:hypothetical protein
MDTVNDIFRTYAPEYQSRFGHAIPGEHRKAITAIINCRTPASGTTFFRCESCGNGTQFTAPVEIATAQPVSTIRQGSGSKNSLIGVCRDITS